MTGEQRRLFDNSNQAERIVNEHAVKVFREDTSYGVMGSLPEVRSDHAINRRGMNILQGTGLKQSE